MKLWVGDLPKQGRFREIQRLAAVLDVPVVELARDVDAHRGQLTDPITVKTAVHDDQVRYLLEHQADFPGVQIVKTYLRHYPYQSLAAQVLGYVGEISPAQLKRFAGKRDGASRGIARATRSVRSESSRRRTRSCAASPGSRRSVSTRSVVRGARSSQPRGAGRESRSS